MTLATRTDQIIFGTFPLAGREAEQAVALALDCGYRRIDTAQWYENEGAVGAALACFDASDRPLVQTKILPANSRSGLAITSVEGSLKRLKIERIDTLLMHWPPRNAEDFEATVGALVECQARGYARRIGVSNCTADLLKHAATLSDNRISVHQIEYHPMLDQRIAERIAEDMDIELQAYSPLGQGVVPDHPVIAEIGRRRGLLPAAVVLAWIQQQGVTPVCKASHPGHMLSNFNARNVRLTEDEISAMSALRALHRRFVSIADLEPEWDAAPGEL